MNQYQQWLTYLMYLTSPADFATEHALVMRSGSNIKFCNRVCADSAVSDAEVKEVVAYFGATPFRWFVDSKDATQIATLEKNGLVDTGFYPAMAVDLALLPDKEYGVELSIEEVTNQDELDSWVSVAAVSMETDAGELKKFITYLFTRMPSGTIHAYRALYGGKPVATSVVIERGDTIGVHLVGTLPEFRGKGIGYAVTHKPLVDMRKKGAVRAILLASDRGKSVYEKMGFVAYGVYKQYE